MLDHIRKLTCDGSGDKKVGNGHQTEALRKN